MVRLAARIIPALVVALFATGSARAQSRGGAVVTFPRGPLVVLPGSGARTAPLTRAPVQQQRGFLSIRPAGRSTTVWTAPDPDTARLDPSEAAISQELDTEPRRGIGFVPQAPTPRTVEQRQAILASRAMVVRLAGATDAARIRVTQARDALMRAAGGRPGDVRNGAAAVVAHARELDRAEQALGEASHAELGARGALADLVEPRSTPGPIGFLRPTPTSALGQARAGATARPRQSIGFVPHAVEPSTPRSGPREPIGFVAREPDRAGPAEQEARDRAVFRASGDVITARRGLARAELRVVAATLRRDTLVRAQPTTPRELAVRSAELRGADQSLRDAQSARLGASGALQRATEVHEERVAEQHAPPTQHARGPLGFVP